MEREELTTTAEGAKDISVGTTMVETVRGTKGNTAVKMAGSGAERRRWFTSATATAGVVALAARPVTRFHSCFVSYGFGLVLRSSRDFSYT